MPLPLHGVTVLDFSTLLPGPFATLMLAEAGARVIRIERPGGEDMRRFPPIGPEGSLPFASLNAGKETVIVDLKDEAGQALAAEMAAQADVLVEQFRPGVMERLGLGYKALAIRNPRLVYCSISGFGQHGARAGQAGHDINYQALSGLLSQSLIPEQAAPLPPALIADIAGGAYPAVINILLALRERDLSGQGRHLDISMTDGSTPFAWFGLAHLRAGQAAATGGATLLTGGSPRYRLYRTRDGWFLAVGALEEKFWATFCAAIGLPEPLRAAAAPAVEAVAAIEALIGAEDAAHWRATLEPLDCCCTVVRTLEEAVADPDLAERAFGFRGLAPLPLDPGLRKARDEARWVPKLEA